MRVADGTLARALRRLVAVEPGEVRGLLLAAAYFFCLLGSYYMVRPVRDALGVSDVDFLRWLFTITFGATLLAVPAYTWLVARLPRSTLLPVVYHLAAASMVAFAALLAVAGDDVRRLVGYAFFVWLSVYNLFGLSAVFWAFMADAHTPDQGKRLFGFIAGGGTCGALVGSAVARQLSGFGVEVILVVAGVVIEVGVLCLRALVRRRRAAPPAGAPVASLSDAFRGARQIARSRYLFAIAAFMVCDILTSTYLYRAQNGMARAMLPAEEERTRFFATVDLGANAVILVLELLVAARVMQRHGLAPLLVLLPAVSLAAVGVLAWVPVLAFIGGAQIVRRGIEFGLAKPAREVLFTVVARQEKYEAKAFIDTAVNRAVDVAVLWALWWLEGARLATPGHAFVVAVPLAAGWTWLAVRLARAFQRRAGAHS